MSKPDLMVGKKNPVAIMSQKLADKMSEHEQQQMPMQNNNQNMMNNNQNTTNMTTPEPQGINMNMNMNMNNNQGINMNSLNMNQNNMVQPDTNSNMFFKQPEPKQSVPTQNNSNMAMETLEQDELVTAAQEMQMPAGGTIQDLNQSSNGVIAPSDFVEPTS